MARIVRAAQHLRDGHDAVLQPAEDGGYVLTGLARAVPASSAAPGTGAVSPRYPDAPPIPFTVLCNPVITPESDEIEDGWEGCLSVPGLRGLVPRFAQLRYQGLDQFGQVTAKELVLQGLGGGRQQDALASYMAPAIISPELKRAGA